MFIKIRICINVDLIITDTSFFIVAIKICAYQPIPRRPLIHVHDIIVYYGIIAKINQFLRGLCEILH